MPRQSTVYRILIASPSDVIQERKAIPEVIHNWNAVNSLRRGVILEPVSWETHARPEMGDRPQAIINKQLVESCDILIGTFWTRLGTHTGVAESGTVEEIEEFIKVEKPVLLYISSVPVVPDSVDTEQYTRLRKFIEQYENRGLIFKYESVADLREKLQRHITSTIDSLEGRATSHTAKKEDDQESTKLSAIQTFKSEYESFLRRLDAEWKAERDSEPYNLDEAKNILDWACSEVLGFRSQIVKAEGTKLTDILDEASKRLKAIQRYQLTMGRGSFDAFWSEGNRILDLLKTVPSEFDKIPTLINTGSNWIENHINRHGELPPLPDYLLPVATKYKPGEPISRKIQLITPSGQFWNRLLPSQRDELLELVEWLGQDPRDYVARMQQMLPKSPSKGMRLHRKRHTED